MLNTEKKKKPGLKFNPGLALISREENHLPHQLFYIAELNGTLSYLLKTWIDVSRLRHVRPAVVQESETCGRESKKQVSSTDSRYFLSAPSACALSVFLQHKVCFVPI